MKQYQVIKYGAVEYKKLEAVLLKDKVPHALLTKVRRISQKTVMGGVSAHVHIESTPGTPRSVVKTGRHEWLHLQAHSHDGKQDEKNLVAGSRDSNSLQIGIEDALIFCRGSMDQTKTPNIQVLVTCDVMSGTHIGLWCEYRIKLNSDGKSIECPSIYVSLQYYSVGGSLQCEHVRAVFKMTCDLIFRHLEQIGDCVKDGEGVINRYAAMCLSDLAIESVMSGEQFGD
jgi:hypothetical protein